MTSLRRSALISLGALVFGIGSGVPAATPVRECRCRPASLKETTRDGANMVIVMAERRSHRALRGVVTNGTRFNNVLVEVFDHPEAFDERARIRRGHEIIQHRLAACITNADGRFCFSHIPAGRYELRASVDASWNITHLLVSLAPVSGRTASPIVITMYIGV